MVRFAPLVLVFVLFSLACTDEPTSPVAPNETAPAPAFNFNNNPDGGSTHIYRYNGNFFFVIEDSESPLVSLHTTAPVCGAGILEPVDIQRVQENPDDPMSGKVRQLQLADPINIFVGDTSQPGTCFGIKLLASGTGKLVETDNDRFAAGDNANAWGFVASGVLYSPSGQKAHYSGHIKFAANDNKFHRDQKFNFRWAGN